jgi:hypothetical protein
MQKLIFWAPHIGNHELTEQKERWSIYMQNTSEMKLIFNPLNTELNPICYLPALLGAHLIFHVRGLRVKSASWVVNPHAEP